VRVPHTRSHTSADAIGRPPASSWLHGLRRTRPSPCSSSKPGRQTCTTPLSCAQHRMPLTSGTPLMTGHVRRALVLSDC
jgi:hypothetical protein